MEIVIEAGEAVEFEDSYRASEKCDPFSVTIADRAIYMLVKRAFALRNPW